MAPLGLAGAGTAAGVALAAIDTFMQDRMLSKYSPKIYVQSVAEFAAT